MPRDDGTLLHRNAGGLWLTFGTAVLMQVTAAHAGRLHLDDDIVSLRRGIGKLHQFQPAFAREYNAAHRFLRLFLLWPDFEPKRRDWQSANQWRAGVTKDQGFRHLPASAVDASKRNLRDLAHKDPAQASDRQAPVLQGP